MSGPKWTPAQRAAIDDRGGSLLVSAAAGSGKTAVLTERAVRLITDPERPVDADRLLVVTFTNAAAAELRARIGQALLRRSQAEPGNTALRRQRMLLQRAPICALLHDLCKANYYKAGTRNVKNEVTGQWEKVPSYSVEDLFPYGHGEKSVFLIERFMKLRIEEAVAIRWHMGGFDDAARGGCFAISEAYDKYPLAVKLHIADLEATYLMEHRTSAVR